ncbi:MAG: hypothetical protein CR971_00740, partial [candidate division SR1 bacterium]
RDEPGKNGKIPATVFQYTPDQIRRKLEILKEAGFKTWERKALLLFGFCGEREEKIARETAKVFADDIAKQFQENLPDEDTFDDSEWNKLEDDVKKSYNHFTDPEAKEIFKKTLQDRADALPETPEGEEDAPEKKKLNTILNNLEQEDQHQDPGVSNTTSNLTPGSSEGEDGENNNERNRENDEDHETPAEAFNKAWSELQGDYEATFKEGTNIYINVGDSNYPPKHDSKARLRLEITKTPATPGSGTFEVKVYNATSDFEGMDDGLIKSVPATAEMLRSWTTNYGTDYVKKVKKEENPRNFKEAFNTLNNAGLFEKGFSHVFAKEGEDKTWFDEDKKEFYKYDSNGKKIPVKYFSNTKSIGKKQEAVGWTTEFFEITSIKDGLVSFKTNWTDLHPDKPSEKINYEMKRTLRFSDFILLMEDKQLVGYDSNPNDENKHKGNKEIKRDSARGDRRFGTFNELKNAIKFGWKKVTEEKLKSHSDDESEALGNILYSDEGFNLFGKGAKLFRLFGPLSSGLAEACDMAQAEYYSEREDRAWKKINYWYGVFDKDPHFGTLWHNRLKDLFKLPPEKIWKNNQLRYKFAAAMLITMKKDGPWTKFLKDKPGKGFWVERLLGEKHRERFRDFQELKDRELKNHEKLNHVHWKNPRTTMLARLEFDYIVGVIDGRKPYGDGNVDEHFFASRWSRKFATQLQENTDKYFGSAVKKAEELKDLKDFPLSQQEYYRHMGTMRPHKSIPYLLNMARTAQSTQEMNQVKRAILGALLSGLLWNHADHATRTELWKISRSMGFIPGTWIRNQNQKERIWTLLKHVTNGKIEKELQVSGGRYAVNKFGIDNNENLVKFITEDFPSYWAKNGGEILNYLEMKDPKYRTGPQSILTLAHDKKNPDHIVGQDYITPEFDLENDDQETRYIYQYAEESPWTASKSLVRHFMPQNGRYVKQTDEVEIEGAKAFWKSVTTNLNTISSKNEFEFFLSRFHSWFSENVFDQGTLTNLLRSIRYIKEMKNDPKRKEEGKYVLWYTIYGNIVDKVGGAPTEFSSAINKFVDILWDNIDNFTLDTAKNVFGEYTNTIDRDFKNKPYKSVEPEHWKDFKNNYVDAGSSSRERTNFRKRFDDGDYFWESINYTRKSIKRKNGGNIAEPTPPWKMAA